MKYFLSKFSIYLAGILSGFALMGLLAVWVVVKAPGWLVIEGEAHKADVAVVLGGGGGSRLRMGLSLYDDGLVDRLLLVDTKKQYWKDIQKYLCQECVTEGKDVVVLDGSTSTFSDASLVLEYCESHDVDSILIVTDPYHTRRALLVFESRFEGSGVDISIVSTGHYPGSLSPGENWWDDNKTSKLVWGELSKVILFYFRGISSYVTSKT